jgi:hypothetical protein
MTGHEHYRKAESALNLAEGSELGSEEERYHLLLAQAHTLLAIAAAAGEVESAAKEWMAHPWPSN